MSMRLNFLKINSGLLAVMVVTAVFLSSVFLGLQRGVEAAKAAMVYHTASVLRQGLDYFFSDQDRFPSVVEFNHPNILLTYFTHLPDNVSQAAICPKNFVYKRLTANSYELDFCLAQNVGNLGKGWNKVVVSK